MRIIIYTVLIFSVFLTGCSRAFYLNPYQGIAPTYRSVQLQKDSVRSAFQFTGTFIASHPNPEYNDRVLQLNANMSRAHSFKNFGFRYGASLSLGSYKVSSIDTVGNSNTVDHKYINEHAGIYSTGGYGLDGAVHLLHVNYDVEWRIIGIEFTANQEFGDFFGFRRNMPAHAATIIDRDDFFPTLGVYTEVINTKDKLSPGFKFGYGKALRPSLSTPDGNIFDQDHEMKFRYMLVAASLRTPKSTFFLQANLGEKARSIQLGGSFRLGRN